MLFVPPDAAMKVRWLHSAALLCRTTSFYLIPSFLFFFPRGPRSADQVRQVTRESLGRKGPYCPPLGGLVRIRGHAGIAKTHLHSTGYGLFVPQSFTLQTL
jgi:hypothetical protein